MRLIDADVLKKLRDDVISGKVYIETEGDLIDACPTINPYEWISVKDRLPNKDEEVLVYRGIHRGLMDVYTYIDHDEWDDAYGYCSGTDNEGITHWMPLPAPPTAKEN